ncbi:MAG TPA: hypothetical protein VGC41_14610 [Kofleriaceae bacterium]
MRATVITALAVLGTSAIAHADDVRAPQMSADHPVMCLRDASDQVWRIQCDPASRVCLFAPNEELDSTGGRTGKGLERARTCELDAPFDRKQMEAQGFTFIPGRVDAPYGWMRDERQRVFQVNFDLHRRMYFGVAYAPQKVLDNPLESTRTSVNFGLFSINILDDNNGKNKTMHRLRLFEGAVHMQPFSAEFTMAHYDLSHRFLDPLLRITTFVGTPQRHDLVLDLGMWSEVGNLELHQTPMGNSQLWRHATAQVTIDLWQSANLDSFARIRTGLGVEGQRDDVNGYRSAITESSAFDIDWVLDEAGFHNVRFELSHEIPRYFTPTATTGQYVQRFKANLQYEQIILAINDQPLTFNLAAGGQRRNDLPGVPDVWAFTFDAGLRFSLWAPPRSHS